VKHFPRGKDKSSHFKTGQGRRIPCARVALGQTQETRATDLGIVPQTLTSFENNHTETAGRFLKRLCEDLALDEAWLLLGDVSRTISAYDEGKVV